MSILIEACCGSVEEAVAAQIGGADRIELCAGLPTGGTTPSLGMLEEARERVRLPIVAMVRPKEGRANPSEEDFRAAVRDVRHLSRAGADQIIAGVLDDAGRVDLARNRALAEAAEGTPIAFHRVFDATPDRFEALEALIELGFCRVLTSGGAPNVDAGMAELAALVARADGRITILPGGGVRPHNVRALAEIGCREVHFSFRRESPWPGYGGVPDSLPDPERIRQVRAILEQR